MLTTVSQSLAQQIVNTVHDICGHDINFINKKGIIFASTNEARIGTFHEIGREAAETKAIIEVTENDSYRGTSCGVNIPITQNGAFIAVIGISGNPDEVRSYARLAERITRLFLREQELNASAHTLSEKKRFLLNALTSSNFDEKEYILSALEDFQIDPKTPKRILIFRLHDANGAPMHSSVSSKLLWLFENTKIVLFSDYYPDRFLALADAETFAEYLSDYQTFARSNRGMLSVGVGRAEDIYRLEDSFHTASIALQNASQTKVGKEGIGFTLFDDLTLEILLNSVSAKDRKEYLSKVLASLSDEDIALLSVYYSEGQSLTRTCERLFLHKNTVQYKLNRISRRCGFNPRDFEDAVILYLALRISESPAAPM